MKPCFSKRKRIALLALGELDARRAQDLRALMRNLRWLPPLWGMLATWQSATRLNWRVALPAIGVAMLVILMLSILARQPGVSPPARISRPVVAWSASREDLSPTVANYQRAASRSLDELDELLTRQARRTPSHTPIYTASIFPLAHAPD